MGSLSLSLSLSSRRRGVGGVGMEGIRQGPPAAPLVALAAWSSTEWESAGSSGLPYPDDDPDDGAVKFESPGGRAGAEGARGGRPVGWEPH